MRRARADAPGALVAKSKRGKHLTALPLVAYRGNGPDLDTPLKSPALTWSTVFLEGDFGS